MRKFFLTLMVAASTALAFGQAPQQADSTRHGGPHHEGHHHHGAPEGQRGPQGQMGPGGPGAQGGPQKNPFFMDKVFKTFMVKGYAQGGYYYIDKDPKKHSVTPNMIPVPNAPESTMMPDPKNPFTTHDDKTSTFDMKRAYIFAQANLTDHFSFWIMYDFCGEFNEYYLEYKAFKGGQLNFRLGQQKHPFGLENPYSPTKVELIDVYSQATTYLAGVMDPLMGVQYGRELGLVMLGDIMNKHVHYEFAVLNGSGINCTDRNNDKDFAGRIEISPVQQFKVVGSLYNGTGNVIDGPYPLLYTRKTLQGAPNETSTLKPGMDYDRSRWAIGAEYRSQLMQGPGACDYWDVRPIVLRTEYLQGKDDCYKSEGFYVTGAYPLPKCRFDVVASYDYMNYNKDLDLKQTNIVAGIQYWVYKQCRVQLQYTHCDSELNGKYNQIQLQTQVAF